MYCFKMPRLLGSYLCHRKYLRNIHTCAIDCSCEFGSRIVDSLIVNSLRDNRRQQLDDDDDKLDKTKKIETFTSVPCGLRNGTLCNYCPRHKFPYTKPALKTPAPLLPAHIPF